jgi:hypothetical protein
MTIARPNIFSLRLFLSGSGLLHFSHFTPILIALLVGLPHSWHGLKAMVRTPLTVIVVLITRHFRIAASTARNGVSKTFYLGVLTAQDGSL